MSETEPEPEIKTEASGVARKLTDEQWEEIRELYEMDKAGTIELSARFSVSKQAIHAYFRKHKIVRGSRLKTATATVASTEAEEWAASRATKIAQVRAFQLKSHAFLQSEVMTIIRDAKAAGEAISTRGPDFKALKLAAEVLQKAREAMFDVLDKDKHVDEEGLPAFEIKDLSEDDIKELRKADEETDFGEIGAFEDDDEIIEKA